MLSISEIINQMTVEEKARLITGSENMATASLERFGIEGKTMADGPAGIRNSDDIDSVRRNSPDAYNSLCLPCESLLGSTWDTDLIETAAASRC